MSFFERIEPETRRYLKKIFLTMAYSIGWLFANVGFGLILQFAYVDGRVSTENIVYYIVSLTFLFLLIRWLVKTWKGSDKEPTEVS